MTALLRGREKGYFKKNLWSFYWPPALQGVPHFCCLNASGLWCCWPQRPLCHPQLWGCWSFGRTAWNCCYSGHSQDQSPPFFQQAVVAISASSWPLMFSRISDSWAWCCSLPGWGTALIPAAAESHWAVLSAWHGRSPPPSAHRFLMESRVFGKLIS